jgi:excisionase family DNA binding protein
MSKLTQHNVSSSSSHVEMKTDNEFYQNFEHLDQPMLLTVKQAAKLMNLSIATVYRLIQAGDIPSLLIRGSRRFSREALQQWIRDQQQSC